MMNPELYLTIAAAALAGLAMVVAGALAGWRGWLALKRQELSAAGHDPVEPARGNAQAGARIEIADLRERIRKLEAIAAGVDL